MSGDADRLFQVRLVLVQQASANERLQAALAQRQRGACFVRVDALTIPPLTGTLELGSPIVAIAVRHGGHSIERGRLRNH